MILLGHECPCRCSLRWLSACGRSEPAHLARSPPPCRYVSNTTGVSTRLPACLSMHGLLMHIPFPSPARPLHAPCICPSPSHLQLRQHVGGLGGVEGARADEQHVLGGHVAVLGGHRGALGGVWGEVGGRRWWEVGGVWAWAPAYRRLMPKVLAHLLTHVTN